VANATATRVLTYRATISASLAILGLLCCSSVAALNPDVLISQLQHTAWGPRDGAPVGPVLSLAQTIDGYLWLATPNGLYQFDGIVFERVQIPQSPKLSSLQIYRIFSSRDGALWVGFTFGGVARLKNGRWQIYGADDGVPRGSATEFIETADGTLWVGASGGFGYFDGMRWSTVGPEQGLPATPLSPGMFVDGQGTLWINAQGEIFTRRKGEMRFQRYPYVPARLGGFAESPTGVIWHDESIQLTPIAQNPPPVALKKVSGNGPVVDPDGGVWVMLDSLRRLAHSEHAALGVPIGSRDIADVYTQADGLTAGDVISFLLDREGNLWAGTSAGLDRFSESRFEAPLQSKENRGVWRPDPNVGVAPTGEAGGLYVTNGQDTVFRYKNGHLTPFLKQQITCILYADDHAVWFGGPDGLWYQGENGRSVVPLPVSGAPLQALAMDKSGALWVLIMRSGVFRLQDGRWTDEGDMHALPEKVPITIGRGRGDRMWFSYTGGVVAMLDGDRVQTFGRADGLSIGNVLAIQAGATEQWFGGDFGVARFDGQRFYGIPTVPELPVEGVTGIVETSAGDLWVNGRMGIVHLEAAELERNRQKPSYRVKGETIGAFDGLVGSAFGLRRSVAQTDDGKLWFATSEGFFGVDPRLSVHNRVPPPVLIRAVKVGDRSIAPAPDLKFPVRTTAVRFDFVALSLTAAQKVRYRYRLEGVDSGWSAITAAREALYTNLGPGSYTFRVIADNNDGVWNVQGAALEFTIPPAFVQTRAFVVLCVAAGTLAIWGLVRLRVRQVTAQVQKRLEERIAERERIARDLHDTLLQGVQALLFRLQIWEQDAAIPKSQRSEISAVIHHTKSIVLEARRRILRVRQTMVQNTDLAESLAAIGKEMSNENVVAIEIRVDGKAKDLTADARDQLAEIAREAIRNAYQHAKASRVGVNLEYGKRFLLMSISDDGRGFDSASVEGAVETTHFGLRGMRERAGQLGGHLRIDSCPMEGTRVKVIVPARKAYRAFKWRRRWRAVAVTPTTSRDDPVR
jgi:signal transduction histidine kinase/ligand-binding sensor domain-containing protein